jgi:hypothetical protein
MPEIPVPPHVRDAVLYELYRQIGELDWDEVSLRQRTAYYTEWVEDPAIGGELADYYTAEGIRVWLKDTPVKEYARALEDFGPFARYTTKHLSPAREFIAQLLGPTWSITPRSLAEKPMHCIASNEAETRYVCWGKASVFRDLLWAAVNEALNAETPPLIVVYTTEGKPVTSKKRLQQRLAEHCGVEVAHVVRRLENRPEVDPG